MAYRLVRARPKAGRLPKLRERLDDGEIRQFDPYGRAMTKSLKQARIDTDTGEAVWVEEDYCSPPLAMEREVLEEYFTDITVVNEDVDEATGWAAIEEYPSLWERLRRES